MVVEIDGEEGNGAAMALVENTSSHGTEIVGENGFSTHADKLHACPAEIDSAIGNRSACCHGSWNCRYSVAA